MSTESSGLELTVREGDILIGKITPKGETDPSPEEKLLRAIFGDKAGDVKDASLKAGPSLRGVVVDKKLFSRAIKDRKTKAEEKPILAQLDEDYEKEAAALKGVLIDKLLVNARQTQVCKVSSITTKKKSLKKESKFSSKILADS